MKDSSYDRLLRAFLLVGMVIFRCAQLILVLRIFQPSDNLSYAVATCISSKRTGLVRDTISTIFTILGMAQSHLPSVINIVIVHIYIMAMVSMMIRFES